MNTYEEWEHVTGNLTIFFVLKNTGEDITHKTSTRNKILFMHFSFSIQTNKIKIKKYLVCEQLRKKNTTGINLFSL